MKNPNLYYILNPVCRTKTKNELMVAITMNTVSAIMADKN